MIALRPRHVALIRAGSGYLHIGIPTGRGWDTACFKTIRNPNTRVWHGHAAENAWLDHRAHRCPDCSTLRKRGWKAIRRITGW